MISCLSGVHRAPGARSWRYDRALDPVKRNEALALANRQLTDMDSLTTELVDYAVILKDRNDNTSNAFFLRDLHDELVAATRPRAGAKGLN
jgi:hypothetical protein